MQGHKAPDVTPILIIPRGVEMEFLDKLLDLRFGEASVLSQVAHAHAARGHVEKASRCRLHEDKRHKTDNDERDYDEQDPFGEISSQARRLLARPERGHRCPHCGGNTVCSRRHQIGDGIPSLIGLMCADY